MLGLTACGQEEAKVIKVGATVGPPTQMFETVAKQETARVLNGRESRFPATKNEPFTARFLSLFRRVNQL